jgi:hypothetical protein
MKKVGVVGVSPGKPRGSGRARSPASGEDSDDAEGASYSGGVGCGGCLSWQCLGICCLIIFTNILTSWAWIWYMRGTNQGSTATPRGHSSLSDEIASILRMSHAASATNGGMGTYHQEPVTSPHQPGSGQGLLLKPYDEKHVSSSSKDSLYPPVASVITAKSPDVSTATKASSATQKPTPLQKEKKIPKVKQDSNLVEKRDKFDQVRVQEGQQVLVSPIRKSLLDKYTRIKPSERSPVLGNFPANGTRPLWGFEHKGEDAIFALATNYPTLFYKRFVGSLRKSKYEGDVVLAVSPPAVMKDGVENYLKTMHVLAYPFEVICQGIDNCMFKDNFLGYPDPRPMRTFANIRYALYEYWLTNYHFNSYILILDFRDTFFQLDPFLSFGKFEDRQPKYELQVFEENFKVCKEMSCGVPADLVYIYIRCRYVTGDKYLVM